MPLLAQLDDWSLVAAFFASVIFVIGASFLIPWWRTLAGRSMVLIDVALAVALAPSAEHHFFPGVTLDATAFAWYYFVSFCLVIGVTLWRLGVIYAVQRRGRKVAAARRAAEAEVVQQQTGGERGPGE